MRWLPLCVLLGACDPYDVCDVVTDVPLPARLSETFRDAPGARPYAPTFALWSDGAEKTRWLWLPPGGTIDTSDPDEWDFPIGTRAWKEFRVDGVRIETRLIQRLDDGSWADLAYAWEPDQSEAFAIEAGSENALATRHDIPSAGACRACHGGRKSHLLGVSAIQLAHPAATGELALDELNASGRLQPPVIAPVVPGDDVERAALGYLQANCSHCHNQTRPESSGARCYDPDNDVDFALRVDPESPAVGVGAALHTARDRHDRMLELMARRGSDLHMPPLATEDVDREGVAAMRAWLDRF